jgi:hypothetical protein
MPRGPHGLQMGMSLGTGVFPDKYKRIRGHHLSAKKEGHAACIIKFFIVDFFVHFFTNRSFDLFMVPAVCALGLMATKHQEITYA